MGFFSSLISGISSIGHAICSGISHICSGLGKLGSGISSFAEKAIGIGEKIFPHLEILEVLKLAVHIIVTVAEALGLKEKEKDSPEEIAMKAEEADKKPEDFESTEAYIKYLQNEIRLDKEKMEKLTPEEKAEYAVVGSAIYLKAAAEKLGVEPIDAPIIMDFAKAGIDPKEMVSIIKELKNNGITDTKSISDYLHGHAQDLNTSEKVEKSIFDGIKNMNPDMSKKDVYDKISDIENAVEY